MEIFLFCQAPPFLSCVLALFKSDWFYRHLLPSVFPFEFPSQMVVVPVEAGWAEAEGGRSLCQKLEVGRSLERGDRQGCSAAIHWTI